MAVDIRRKKNMATSIQPLKPCAFSEEDICVVSKDETSIILTGTKILYSGVGGGAQASGYNYLSGDSDVEPYNWLSGTGKIRIPEINQLHKLFVFPRNPRYIAHPHYDTLTLGTTSGLPSGVGGCSGKVALLEWLYLCSGAGGAASGEIGDGIYGMCAFISGYIASGNHYYTSGLVDYIAFGSRY